MQVSRFYIAIACYCAVFAAYACDSSHPSPRKNSTPHSLERTDSLSRTHPSILDITTDAISITHRAKVKTTVGEFTIALFGDDAPLTVENFVGLARRGSYNRVLFHRIVRNFFVQTGDPKTRSKRKRDEWGTGGESIYGKPFKDELDAETPSYQMGYVRGTVAMANNGPDANMSQFFICLDDIPDLPSNFTIFGKVIDGMSVVDSIASVAIEPLRDAEDGMPTEPISITRITVAKEQKKK